MLLGTNRRHNQVSGSAHSFWKHGTNGLLLKKKKKKLSLLYIPQEEEMFSYMFQVVNMEWRNFWFSHLPRTTYDMDLDAESSNPNDMVVIFAYPLPS